MITANIVLTCEAFKRRNGAIVVFRPRTARRVGGAYIEFAVVEKRSIRVEVDLVVDATDEKAVGR